MSKEKTTSSHKEEKTTVSHKVFTVIGIVLCVILIPMLIINITLIIKSNTDKDSVPSIGGYVPMIVLTDSMYPDIKSGDLIICHTIKAEDVKEQDVIAFFDPAGNGSSVVTHRVVEIVTEDGKLSFRTKGDNNNIEDKVSVPAENLVGIYKTRIPLLGNVAMFMQTTTGLIVCIALPIILLVGYDILRRRVYEKKKQTDTDALLAELEALKAEKAAQEEPQPEAAEVKEETVQPEAAEVKTEAVQSEAEEAKKEPVQPEAEEQTEPVQTEAEEQTEQTSVEPNTDGTSET